MNSIPAIILARGGSKAIPYKNLLEFAGKPLVAWSILQARAAKTVTDVYVSSDSTDILTVAKRYGAIPIQRPRDLSTDTATSESGWLHALEIIKADRGSDPEALVAIQATSPLREPSDIDGAVETFFRERVDSLFSDAVLDDLCAWTEEGGVLRGKTYDPFNRGRRQDREPLFLENGSIYVFRSDLLRSTGNRLGGMIARYTMDYWKSFEIDSMEHFQLCEYYFRRNLLATWADEESGLEFKPDLIVYDFDGVMTDNRVLVLQDGTEGVLVNRADGWGVGTLARAGFRQVVLSTELNPVVAARAEKLGLEVIQGSADKARDLAAFCATNGISLAGVLYVGNDVNDLEAMRVVGYPVAPADAHAQVLTLARLVTRAKGGEGVIKELSELLLPRKKPETRANAASFS